MHKMEDPRNAFMRKLRVLNNENMPWMILMLGAIGLRFLNLSQNDIWVDEAISVFSAKAGYANSYRFDYIAFGYYFLVRCWMELFGTSLFALRSLSAIASVLCVYPLYRFTQAFFDRKVAFIATALFVVSPFQIWYAQELRNYSLMVCESLFFLHMLWRYRQTRSACYMGIAILIFMVGFVTDYRMSPYLLGIAAFFWRDLGRLFWVSLCVLFALVAACFSKNLHARWELFLELSFWPLRPKMEDMLITLNNFIFGYIRHPAFNVIMLGVTGLLLIAVIFMSLRDRRLWMVKAFCFIPIMGAWILSQFSVSVYVDRYFIVCSPAWYALIAYGMVCMRKGILKTSAVTILCVCLFFALLLYYTGLNERTLPLSSYFYRMHKGTPFKPRVAPVFEFFRDHYEPGDMIFFTNSDISPPLLYYFFKDKKTIRRSDAWPSTYVSVSDFFMEKRYFSARRMKAMVRWGKCVALDAGAWPPAKRYWLVSSHWHRGAKYSSQDNQTLVSQYMCRTAERIRSYHIEGVNIDLFVISTPSPKTVPPAG